MKIGVISDSHDNKTCIEKAVNVFISEKVDYVIHCGDFIAPFVKNWFQPLKDKGIKFYGVLGNNDGEKAGLFKILGEICDLKGKFLELEIDSLKIIAFHHLNESMIKALGESGEYDLILKGHTHKKRAERIGKSLLVNPGECCGYLTNESSIAIMDSKELDPDKVNFITL